MSKRSYLPGGRYNPYINKNKATFESNTHKPPPNNSSNPPLPIDMTAMFSRFFTCPHCGCNLSQSENLIIRNDIRDIRLVNYESEGEDDYPSSRVLNNPVNCVKCKGPFSLAESYSNAAKVFEKAAENCKSSLMWFYRNKAWPCLY